MADAIVEKGQRPLRLIGIIAEMGGGVRVLLVLAQPLFIVPRLRGFLVRMERLIALIPREERGHEQQQHDEDGPFEVVVAAQADEFIAGYVSYHGALLDRKSTRLNSSPYCDSRMPSPA